MRNFTFRAFNTRTKTWLCHYKEIGGFSLIGECVIFGEWASQLGSIEGWNDIVIMQATGLKDKNGKEIYEGDIVRSETYEIGRAVVEWDYSHWQPFQYFMSLVEEDFEVIGNKFENPDLLTS